MLSQSPVNRFFWSYLALRFFLDSTLLPSRLTKSCRDFQNFTQPKNHITPPSFVKGLFLFFCNGSEAVKKLKHSLNRKKSLLIIKNLRRRLSAIFNFFTASRRRRTRRAKAGRARHSVRAVVPSHQSARTE